MNERSPYKKPNFESKNILYIALSVAIIIIAISFFYYNVIHKPRLEKNKIELQKIEQEREAKLQLIEQDKKLELLKIEQEKELEKQRIERENVLLNSKNIEAELEQIEKEYINCKANAQDTYLLNWGRECRARGLNTDGSLPKEVAEGLLQRRRENLERCEREYKIKLETLKLKPDMGNKSETSMLSISTEVSLDKKENMDSTNINARNTPNEKIEDSDSMSIYEKKRLLGLAQFEKEVIALAKKSDQMDIEYRRYKDACLNRSTYVHTYGRNWFSIWGGSVLINNESTPECLKIWSDFSRLAKEIKAGMEYSMELARKAGVYPGQVRKMREKYYMDWTGWD